MADIDALKTEIDGDLARYGGFANDALGNVALAENINTKDVTRIRASMSGDELFQQTDAAEFNALAIADEHKQQMWVSFCARDSIDPGAAANVSFVQHIFGPGPTLTALNAARNENISRAEELGLGEVAPGHIAEARK